MYYEPEPSAPPQPIERLPDLPYKPAQPQDTRYRDMCVTGAVLGQEVFDPVTGLPKAQDITPGSTEFAYYIPGDSIPDSMTNFDEIITGRVLGAKPYIGTCMPMKDTPVIDVNNYNENQDLIFAYFMNMNDQSFIGGNMSLVTSGSATPQDIYGGTNYYKNKTFFVGGTLGCPDLLQPDSLYNPRTWPPDPATIYDRAYFRQLQADNCYNYYILNHATGPWSVIEIPAGGSDDPLSVFDPMRSYLNSCQPIVNGNSAREIKAAGWDDNIETSQMEKKAGFAPVWRYPYRPDMNEADYSLNAYLRQSWEDNFVNNTMLKPVSKRPNTPKNPFNTVTVNLPCIRDLGGSPPGGSLPDPHGVKKPPAGPQCENYDSPPYYYYDCGPPYRGIPADNWGYAPNQVQYYCPNVEKIIEPSNPYSPRWDIAGSRYDVDRDYAWETSICVPETTCPAYDVPEHRGYTTFEPKYCRNDYGVEGEWITTSPWYNPELDDYDEVGTVIFPPVICAVVPVDILSFRAEAFDSCIMQRINTNFNQWIADGFPPPDTWTPPCATRFFEYDTVDQCPVKLSIQQCCRIIVKDLVPANFLKMRTVEGLLQSRRDAYYDGFFETPDNELYAELGGGGYSFDPRADSITYVNDDTYGAIDIDSYIMALLDNQTLNQFIGNSDRVPPEYQFKLQDFISLAPMPSYSRGFASTPEFTAPDIDSIDATPPTYYPYKFVGFHMPYMRWWDTGVSAGNPRHGGSFLNTLGGFDTLIGVGREERDHLAAEKEALRAETIGANGIAARLRDPQLSQMGRVGGWSELKAHQMWSIRRSNLFCIGRYEKLFKPGGPEDLVLAKAGAGYTSQGGLNPDGSYNKNSLQFPWPLGWRGYITDINSVYPWSFFPNVPEAPGARGLDNALPGDIIVYYINGLPQIAYVTDVGFDDPGMEGANFDFTTSKFLGLAPSRVKVVMWDQGKFPTSTGSSINWGMGPERTIYKYQVPPVHSKEVCATELRALTDTMPGVTDCRGGFTRGMCGPKACQPSCYDTSYKSCVLPPNDGAGLLGWEDVWIYRPYWDVRPCSGAITEQPDGKNFSLANTYAWTGWSGDPYTLPAADPTVLYQSMTQQVNTDLWSYCANAGYDPPFHFTKEYRGAQTGALTDATLCGPGWGGPRQNPLAPGCSSKAGSSVMFSPGMIYR